MDTTAVLWFIITTFFHLRVVTGKAGYICRMCCHQLHQTFWCPCGGITLVSGAPERTSKHTVTLSSMYCRWRHPSTTIDAHVRLRDMWHIRLRERGARKTLTNDATKQERVRSAIAVREYGARLRCASAVRDCGARLRCAISVRSHQTFGCSTCWQLPRWPLMTNHRAIRQRCEASN